MKIPLDQFEQHFPESILKRGLDYFRKGKVVEVEETSPGIYTGIVEGTSSYEVRLEVQKGAISAARCNCPYTDGVLCKHMAALVFYLQQDVLDIPPMRKRRGDKPTATSKTTSTKGGKKARSRKDKQGAIEDMCKQASKEDLVQFIKSLSATNKSFAIIFRQAFAHLDEDRSIRDYAADMRALLKAAIGSGAYNWRNSKKAGDAAKAFLYDAEKHFAQGNLKTTAMICFGSLEELTKAIQYVDDSNADIGGNINLAIDLLYRIIEAKPQQEVIDLMKEYALSAYKKKTYEDWDWHLDMINIVACFEKEPEKANALIRLIETEGYSEFSSERIAMIIFRILMKSGQEKAAAEYRKSNTHIGYLRRMSVQMALEKSDYKEAIRLLDEGYSHDLAKYPGRASQWEKMKLNVYDQWEKGKEVLSLSRSIFMKEHFFDAVCYTMMKKWCLPSKWPAFAGKLIAEQNEKSPKDYYGKTRQIYVQESMWEELLHSVIKEAIVWHIEEFDQHLAERFPDAWNKYIKIVLTNEAQLADTRKKYEAIFRHLVRLMKSGREELAQELAADFKKTYGHRPAMLDVLAGIAR
jgi:hypothetical protein